MSREDLIKRIEALSESELGRIGPILEHDLALLAQPDPEIDAAALEAEIRAGQESARRGPLESNAAVQERARQLVSGRS